jgi:hypothetical protein
VGGGTQETLFFARSAEEDDGGFKTAKPFILLQFKKNL